MKKSLLFTLMMLAALSSFSQARRAPKTFTIQPFIGATVSKISNAPEIHAKDRWIETTTIGGSIIGAEAEYLATERIGLSFGVNYAEAGNGWDDYNFYDDKYVKYTVKETAWKNCYLNVPMTVNWYFGTGLSLKVGMQLSFLTSAKEYMRTEYSMNEVDYSLTSKQDCMDEFSKFDFVIPIGLSYEFNFPLVIDLNFNIGLSKVNNHSFISDNYHNRQATLTLGYKFKL